MINNDLSTIHTEKENLLIRKIVTGLFTNGIEICIDCWISKCVLNEHPYWTLSELFVRKNK